MATNPRSSNGHRRRSLRARILARDEVCWLCKKPVDKTLKTPHPMSPEVHEIIPISRGGSAVSLSNTTLTHRQCNLWIGARTPEELMQQGDRRNAPQPFTTSQAW